MTRLMYRNNRRSSVARVMSATLALIFMLSFVSVVRAETGSTVTEVAAESTQPSSEADPVADPAPTEEAPPPEEEPAAEAPAPEPEAAPEPEPAAEPEPAQEAAPEEAPKEEVIAPVEPEADEQKTAAVAAVAPSVVASPPPDPGGYTTVGGNPVLCAPGFRIENPTSGTYTYMYGETLVTVTLSVVDVGYGPVVSWTSDYPIIRVVVKGGVDGANVYAYDNAMAGSGLHAPLNPSNKWADLSHIDFCLGTVTAPEVGGVIVEKFEDADGSGTREASETALSGWVFHLMSGTTVVREGTTDAEGRITWTDIPFGDYVVHEVLKPGWAVTTAGGVTQNVTVDETTATVVFGNWMPPQPPDTFRKHFALTVNGAISADVDSYRVDYYVDGNLQSAALVDGGGGHWMADVYIEAGAVVSGWVFYAIVDGTPIALTVAGGEETISADMTNTATFTHGVISGIKYIDADMDGATPPDADDTYGAGWTITLDGPGLGAGLTVMTDGSGAYEFTGLLPGNYVVDETLMDGYFRVYPMTAANVMLALGSMSATQDFVNAVEVLAPGDLTMEKDASATTVRAGGMVTYRINYRNIGGTTIDSFTIIDDYPQDLVDIVDTGGAVDDGDKLTWAITEPLAAGESGSVVYSVRVESDVERGTRIINVATIPEFDLEDTEVVVVVSEFLPFTPTPTLAGVSTGAPFLPFTGGELLALLFAANVAAGAGMLLRRLSKH